MIVKFAYGDGMLPLDLRGLQVRHLRPSVPAASNRVEDLTIQAADQTLEGDTFENALNTPKDIAIVVPDTTRKLGLPRILKTVIHRLRRIGFEPHQLTLVVANGTHPPVGEEVIREKLGEVVQDISVLEHNSRDTDNLVSVGESSRGNQIRLNRTVMESDAVITIGAVKHHYFAGFGGGPKMIFPGVGGYEEIQTNHSRVVELAEGGMRRVPECEPGIVTDNPVADEIAEVADFKPPNAAFCVVTGVDSEPVWIGCGSWRRTYSAAIERCRDWYEVPAARFKLMVVSGGGEPTDSTLIQAHKALDAACRFLEPGGEILFLAELGQHSGSPAMEPFLNNPEPSHILDLLSRQWVQYGHTTLRLVDKTSRFRCHLFSQLELSFAERLGFEAVEDPEQVVERWREECAGETLGVMPGACVYPRTTPPRV
ncbi:MAG: DUF2088 domain-containing protein [bacterium]|nr:DUF2088 domain-containing protein [bacterium]